MVEAAGTGTAEVEAAGTATAVAVAAGMATAMLVAVGTALEAAERVLEPKAAGRAATAVLWSWHPNTVGRYHHLHTTSRRAAPDW